MNTSGSIYVAGTFYQSADFDPGSGTYNLTSAGSKDMFVSKLDNSGNFIWAKQFAGTGPDDLLAMAIDISR
ncbi:MAG: hypothetical protein IPP34_15270 [Bacteroidetes bacterium]|nr:hypothetical protein [Bacteroidota bacterium]